MKLLSALLLFGSSMSALAETPTQVAQKLFDAMQAHDATAAATLFLPGATLASLDANGKATVMPFERFVEHIGAGKGLWLEEMQNPKVLDGTTIAVVWANYVFKLDGKFNHCGIDAFQLLKTADGWKIAAISDTRQTSNCPDSTR